MRVKPPVARMTARAPKLSSVPDRSPSAVTPTHLEASIASDGDEPVREQRDALALKLLVEHLHHHVAGAVVHVEAAGLAVGAKFAPVEFAVGAAVEGCAHALQPHHRVGRLLGKGLDDSRVAQSVAGLKNIAGVSLGRIVLAQRGVDPALGQAGVGSKRMDLGEQRDLDASLLGGDCRAQSGRPGANHQNIEFLHVSSNSSYR